MKRHLLLLISVFALVSASWADQITREQALTRAQQFLNQKGLSRSLKVAETQMSRARARGKSTPDYYYVFNAGQNQGFVIISGDDRTETVLGYSDRGAFDIENTPPNMAAWLEGYAAQIKYLQENNITIAKKAVTRSSYASVSPFVKVHWDQNSPYNKYCVLDLPTTGKHIQAPTGCVATAMAQAMSVYKYPSATTAEIPAYRKNFGSDGYASYEAIPANTTIDWANLDVLNYNGSEAADKKEAIANLMSYCGRSVETLYNGNASSALVADVANALKTYFGYGKQTVYKKRSWSSDEDWNLMIYNEVAANRPVIYGGQTAENNGVGHAFIIDGYDGGEDAFHINWGWGQLSSSPDGYFKLSALTPAVQGTGGSRKGYNFSQEAVINIAKGDGTFSEQVRLTTESLGLSDKSVFDKEGTQYFISFKAKFVSRLANTYDISCNFAIYKDGKFMEYLNPNGAYQTFSSFTISTYFPASGEMKMYVPYWDGTTLYNAFSTPGTYKIVPVSREASSKEWLENEGSDKYYLTAVCTDTKLTLYLGEPSTNPDSEVTDALRNELKDKLESLKNKITGKQEKVTANATETENLKSSIASASATVSEVDSKLTALKTLIDENELLSEAQKTDFSNKIAELMTKKNELVSTLDQCKTKLESMKVANDNLKKQLDDALKIVNEQIAGVSGITTTNALNAANAKVTELDGLVDGYDVGKVTTAINSAKDCLIFVDVNTLSESVNAIDSNIVKAIADAEAAVEKEKKELEAAKTSMKEAIEAISKAADDKTALVENNNKTIATLYENVKKVTDAAKTVSEKIADIKKLLEDKYISEDQKKEYLPVLEKYVKDLENHKKSLEELSTKLAEREKANAELIDKLQEIKRSLTKLAAKVDAVTKIDQVEALKTDAETLKAAVEAVDDAAMKKDLDVLQEVMKTLALDDTVTVLDVLQKAIQTLIDTAKSDEEKEKEAKKLAEAKEKCNKAVEDLTKVIDDQTKKYNTIIASLEELNKKLKEIDDYIKEFQTKAKAISDMIAEMKLPSTDRTRATADEIKKYEDALANLNAQIDKLSEAKTKVEQKIKDIEGLKDKTQKIIDDATKLRDQVKTGYADATSTEAVEAMITQVTTETTSLNSDGAESINAVIADINTQIAAVEEEIKSINTDVADVNKQTEDLNKEVSEATGIGNISIDENDIQGRYDLSGRPVDANYKGAMIIRMTNGKTIKIFKR